MTNVYKGIDNDENVKNYKSLLMLCSNGRRNGSSNSIKKNVSFYILEKIIQKINISLEKDIKELI